MTRHHAAHLAPPLMMTVLWTLLLVACQSVSTKTYEIRQRAFSYTPSAVVADYQEEYRYILHRRQVMHGTLDANTQENSEVIQTVPPHLAGLAFSGGGIRSATFHLGVLEALNDLAKLINVDYLSTVSGGSYLAGWFLAHLGDSEDDEYGHQIQTQDVGRLLDDRGDFVDHLRHHSGFLREHGFWEGPKLLWSYLWRLPVHLIWDAVFNMKTHPHVGNYIHLFAPYRTRIETTYLRGKAASPLSQANQHSYAAPYLIVNGNLVNRGRPRGYPTRVNRPYRDNYNFEFTRDFTGSDGLGYVQTEGFGLPVVQVLDASRTSVTDDPRWVIVEEEPGHSCIQSLDQQEENNSCARLSDAMTASGAGLDLDSLIEESYRNDIVRLVMRAASVPFNVNNEFQTWNFSRRFNTFRENVWDYFSMLTYERLWPNTRSRWLEVTDGSFYDNLGVQTLLRRQVSHIIVGDATLDRTWQYDYLHNLQSKVKSYFGAGVEWCGEIPQPHEIVWYRRFWIKRPDGPFTVIHYLKPYAYSPELFKKNPHLVVSDSPFLSRQPEYGRDLQREPLLDLRYPSHLDTARQTAAMQTDQDRARLLRGIEKVVKFAQSPRGEDFPQTNTLLQWYELEEFEAYRILGYLMGRAYLVNLTFQPDELAPTTSCTPL